MTEVKEPLTFRRGLTLKNRLIMAPMTTKMSFFDGVVTTDELNYYRLRSGDLGAVITAAANVQEIGKGWEGELGVYHDRFIPGLTQLASHIQQNGTKAILQLFHAGRMTHRSILKGEQPVAPSSIKAERAKAELPRELTHEEILDIITCFKEATRRSILAGFDGVELHGANTYLIQQFFSPHSNRRKDQWGGSLEKRMTFIYQLIQAVVEVVEEMAPKEFIIGYRFSPEEFETPGIQFSDTLYLVDQLADLPLDYLHVSLNDFTRRSISPQYQDKTMLHYLYEKISGRMPLIGVGNIHGNHDISRGLQHADLLAVGRSLLLDPHWAAKVMNHQESLIRQTLNSYEREELIISNGVWSFLEEMMPERLK